MGKEKGGDAGKGYAKGKGKTTKGTGMKCSLRFGRSKEDRQENRKVGDTKDIAGRVVKSDTSHQSVDGESPTSIRMMQTAAKA